MKKYTVYIFMIAIIGMLISGCAEVGPQEGGVRTNYIGVSGGFGQSEWFKLGIKSKPLGPGLYLHIPHVTEIDVYPVKELQYHMFKKTDQDRDDVAFKTKDGQKAWIDVTVRYRLIFKDLPKIHREYGKTYVENVLRPTVRSLVNNKLGEYSAQEIYDGRTRQKVAKEIRQLVNHGFEGQRGTLDIGLEVIDILFRRFEFTEEYQAAIEQKRIASEQHLAAEEMAKKKEAEARGEKLAMIQKAEGEAEKVKKEADARLYAKRKEAEGIAAVGLAEAQAKEAMSKALGGGDMLVRLEFAKHLGEGFQVWGIPTGEKSTSVMDLSGVFQSMFPEPQQKMTAK